MPPHPPRPASRPSRRRGLSTLVVVGGLLVVLGAIAWFQLRLTTRSLSAVERSHLAALARIQGRSAIEELLDQVASDANLPGTPLFEKLRQSPTEPWSRIDLRPFLREPAIDIRPSWGRKGADPVRDLEAELLEYRVLLRSPVASTAPGGSFEYVAVLTLSAIVEARGAAGRVKKGVSATHELRLVRTAPPAPFGMEELVSEGVEAFFEPSAVNAIRQRVLTSHEAFRQELLAAGAARPGPLGDRLTELGQAMADPDRARMSSDPIPTDEPLIMVGAEHSVAGLSGQFLELTQQLEALEAQAEASIEEFRTLLASDPDAARKQAFQASHDAARPLTRLWTFQRAMEMAPKDSPELPAGLSAMLDALDAEYFLDRVHLRVDGQERLFSRWSSGDARLDGVVELRTGGQSLALTAPTWGRTVLVVRGGGRVVLGNAAPGEFPESEEGLFHSLDGEDTRGEARQDSLVLVSLGADVVVERDATAAVLMLPDPSGGPPGRFRVAPDARLRGGVVLRDASAERVEIRGTILEDRAIQAPADPAAGLAQDGPTHYTVAISPAPVFLSPL